MSLDVERNTWKFFDRAVVRDDHVLHLIIPEAKVDE
jgi:hypothetical protein